MPLRPFRPEDLCRLEQVLAPDLSPDGRRVAFVVARVDQGHDRTVSSIWVAPTDGSAPARPFSNGPADSDPTWSPDGRWLAYRCGDPDRPLATHVRLAPVDGGAPTRLGDLPGPVEQLTWAPGSDRIVVTVRAGIPDPTSMTAAQRNAPRVVRGMAARMDGQGWRDGRVQLFSVAVDGGRVRQLTSGDFDHQDPCVSPDGGTVAFVSDRTPQRDDHQATTQVCTVPIGGGRVRRLTSGPGAALSPRYSPDGTLIAFGGRLDDRWDVDARLMVMPSDGSTPPERLAPDTDRGLGFSAPGGEAPLAWLDDHTVIARLADRGFTTVKAATLTGRRARTIIEDASVAAFAVRPGRNLIVHTSQSIDRPCELWVTPASGRRSPRRLTSLHDELLAEVAIAPLSRTTVTRPDGTDIDYFLLEPPGRTGHPVPVHLDVHGGPQGWWPSGNGGSFLAMHQSMAAAGSAVLLPNPRGSGSYGTAFSRANWGDWGGADLEDLMACCDDVVDRGIGDPARMYVSGYSYGGFMTAWVIGHTDRFAAATSGAPVVDQVSMVLTTDIPEFALFNNGGDPWQRAEVYRERSPLTHLAGATTPTQVLHWEGDLRCPMGQGEELWTALRLLGTETAFVRYPGGSHGGHTPSQDLDWITRTIAWDRSHPRRGHSSPRSASRTARSASGTDRSTSRAARAASGTARAASGTAGTDTAGTERTAPRSTKASGRRAQRGEPAQPATPARRRRRG